jgi:hypothetical protein
VNRLRGIVRSLRARYRGRGDPPGWRWAKTTLAAVLAYLLAVWLLGDRVPPLLAPLTALLVAQLTIFETVKSGLERVGSVVAGVLVAVLLSQVVGLTWRASRPPVAVATSKPARRDLTAASLHLQPWRSLAVPGRFLGTTWA